MKIQGLLQRHNGDVGCVCFLSMDENGVCLLSKQMSYKILPESVGFKSFTHPQSQHLHTLPAFA